MLIHTKRCYKIIHVFPLTWLCWWDYDKSTATALVIDSTRWNTTYRISIWQGSCREDALQMVKLMTSWRTDGIRGGLQRVFFQETNKKIHFNFEGGSEFPAFLVLLRQHRLTWRSPSSAAPASTLAAMDASNSTRSPRTEWAGFLDSLAFHDLLLQHHQLGCAAVNTTFTFDA